MKNEAEERLARSIGARIAACRTEGGYTQDRVAEKLGIGPEAVSRIERGVVLPSIIRLIELAELFNCSIEAFFAGSTGLLGDSARRIAVQLEPLDTTDRHFVVQSVESLCLHLGGKAK